MGNNGVRSSSLISKIATSNSQDHNACMIGAEDFEDDQGEIGLMIDCKNQLLCCGFIVEGYKIDKLIGKGTYSQVYRAEKTNTHSGEKHVFAIKCCYSRNNSDWKLITSEVSSMKGLNHENILKFYEYFQIKQEIPHISENPIEPLVAIVMEYCNGGSIGDFLKKNKHLTADTIQLTDWIIQSIRGVRYCHQMNIVHRDIKPLYVDKIYY